MDVLDLILSWPIIVQGALGSALFWLILAMGQKTTSFVSSKLRSQKETGEFFALCAWSQRRELRELSKRGFFTCLYAAAHFLLKALVVIVIALLLSFINHVFAAVGYLLSIYYLFRALSYVPHLSTLGDVDKRLMERLGLRPEDSESQNEREGS